MVLNADIALAKNKVGKALRDDAALTGLFATGRKDLQRLDSVLSDILASVQASAAYNDYKRKRKLDMSDDVRFWSTIFATTIAATRALSV